MASEECVFSRQADRPARVFDRVGVELKTTVVEEAGESFPVSEAVADVFGKSGARGDYRQLFFEPQFQGGDDWGRMLLSSGKTDRGRSTAHHRVNGIKRRDLPDGSFRDRGFRVAHELDEATTQVAPAVHQHPRSLWSLDALEPVVALVAVALQEATAEAMQEALGMFAAPSGRIAEQHDWRTSATKSAIIAGDRPEEALPGPTTPRIEHRRCCFIHEQAIRRSQMSSHAIGDGLRWKQARPAQLPSVARSSWMPWRA